MYLVNEINDLFLFEASLTLFAWLYTDRVEDMGTQVRLIRLFEGLENR